jgi:hypothetical protein
MNYVHADINSKIYLKGNDRLIRKKETFDDPVDNFV